MRTVPNAIASHLMSPTRLIHAQTGDGLTWSTMSWAKTCDACHRPCHDVCHGALHSAHELSQDTWATGAMTRATRPCMVPTSWAKTRDACHHLCHGALHDAHKSSQDTWRVPRGLAWCPWAEPRHVTCATAYAMTCVTGPCLVPTSRAKTRHACHCPCHDACHEALLGLNI